MLARVFHVLGFHLLTHMSVYSRTCMLLVVQCEFLDSNAKYGPSGSSKLCCPSLPTLWGDENASRLTLKVPRIPCSSDCVSRGGKLLVNLAPVEQTRTELARVWKRNQSALQEECVTAVHENSQSVLL